MGWVIVLKIEGYWRKGTSPIPPFHYIVQVEVRSAPDSGTPFQAR